MWVCFPRTRNLPLLLIIKKLLYRCKSDANLMRRKCLGDYTTTTKPTTTVQYLRTVQCSATMVTTMTKVTLHVFRIYAVLRHHYGVLMVHSTLH